MYRIVHSIYFTILHKQKANLDILFFLVHYIVMYLFVVHKSSEAMTNLINIRMKLIFYLLIY
jgi:hypothetical protein